MKIGIVELFVASLHDKTEYVIQIRNLKHALNHKQFITSNKSILENTAKI